MPAGKEGGHWCRSHATRGGRRRQDVVADAFARYDRDGSGFLEASEVVQAVAEIGEVVEGEGAGSSLADRAAALIAEHDQNGDGRLSLREFVRVIEGVL